MLPFLKLVVLILLATFLCSFFFREKVSPVEKLSYEIDRELSKIAKSKYNLITEGTGGSINEKKISLICSHLTYYGKLNLEEARRLLVNLTNDYRDFLENNEKYHEHLQYEPRSLELLEITIFFKNEETSKNEGFFLAYNLEGKIKYSMYDNSDPKKLTSCALCRESFEAAEQILAQEIRGENGL